ncbi:MAG: hypothetical protein WEB53_05925 [Akkermansiaceae bacterium]
MADTIRRHTMITIESDQPELRRALESLVEQVMRGGGWIHESLCLIAEQGSVRVESGLPAGRNELLISVPEEILLPIDEIRMRLSGDEIVIDSFADSATPERRRLAETQIEIYNLCGKIAAHRAVSPRFGFADDGEVARLLAEGRDAKGGPGNLLDDFMHARVFSHGDGSSGKRLEVLMPVVDIFNHHPDATGYLIETPRHPDHPVIGVGHWKPEPDARECFVCYSLFDAFDLAVHYGYLERGCRFVKSVPLVVELEGLGSLRMRAVGGAALRRELPSRLKDLRAWMPVVCARTLEELEISHLIIPGSSDRHALRRVLATMISGWQPGMDLEAVADYVAHAERAVLEQNIRYYERLAESLRTGAGSSLALIESTREMAMSQLGLLRAYVFGD